MNSAQINYFLVLCEEMNYHRASERLNITQQGLSKSIRALEEELGVPLFKRTTHQLLLSEYGEYARIRLSFVLSNINRIKRDLLEMQESRKRLVSLAILEGYCKDNAFTLSDLLGPPPEQIQIVHYYCTYEEGLSLLESETADLFITKGPVDENELDIIATTSEHFFAVVPVGNELSEKRTLSVQDLKGQKIVIFNEKYKFYKNFNQKCQNHGFVPDVLNTANDASAIFLPCILGQGIGIVPEFSIRPELKEVKQIKIIPFDEEMDEEMCFTVLKGSRPPKTIKRFVEDWLG